MPDTENIIPDNKFLAKAKCREPKRGSGTRKHQVILLTGNMTLIGHQRTSNVIAIVLCLIQEQVFQETVCSLPQQVLLGENLFLHRQSQVHYPRPPALRGQGCKKKRDRSFLSSEDYFTTKEAGLFSFTIKGVETCIVLLITTASVVLRKGILCFIILTASFSLSYTSISALIRCLLIADPQTSEFHGSRDLQPLWDYIVLIIHFVVSVQ